MYGKLQLATFSWQKKDMQHTYEVIWFLQGKIMFFLRTSISSYNRSELSEHLVVVVL